MMQCVRRPAAALAAIALALAPAAGLGAGAPSGDSVTQRIFADYADDHVIDGDYSPAELDRAIEVSRSKGAAFAAFTAAVQQQYDRTILGLHEGGPATASDPSVLPVPTAPGERSLPPWPLLALTALGAAVVVTGAGSSLYRRAHPAGTARAARRASAP